MNIALLSDTHGHIDDRIKRHVDGCDEVWHAGDIGDLHVTDALADITKVRAVYGNIDDQLARRTWPSQDRNVYRNQVSKLGRRIWPPQEWNFCTSVSWNLQEMANCLQKHAREFPRCIA